MRTGARTKTQKAADRSPLMKSSSGEPSLMSATSSEVLLCRAELAIADRVSRRDEKMDTPARRMDSREFKGPARRVIVGI